jgi:hypothetical protein
MQLTSFLGSNSELNSVITVAKIAPSNGIIGVDENRGNVITIAKKSAKEDKALA